MDPEIKKLLTENIELAKQNNQMLQKLVRAQKAAVVYKFVYWGVIILISIIAYFVIQPLLGNLLNVYTGGASGGSSMSDTLKNLSDKKQMESVLDTLNAIK